MSILTYCLRALILTNDCIFHSVSDCYNRMRRIHQGNFVSPYYRYVYGFEGEYLNYIVDTYIYELIDALGVLCSSEDESIFPNTQ